LLTIYYWVLNQNVPGDFWSYFVYAQNFYWAIKGGLSYELHVLHFPILFFVAQVVENKWIVGIAAFLITIGLLKLWKLIYK
jgi:hypothetical protein